MGKSTLASLLAADRESLMVTLDDPSSLAAAKADPAFFVDQAAAKLLIIDEAPRAPELILPLKAAVDRDREPGRFLLTASADLLQVKGAGDSLAGRAETFELSPLSQGELARRSTPEDFVSWVLDHSSVGNFSILEPTAVITGGYSTVQPRSHKRAQAWFASYAARLSDHDARELYGGGYAVIILELCSPLLQRGASKKSYVRIWPRIWGAPRIRSKHTCVLQP